jgi:Domain of unknown function (DUF4157)
VKITYEGPVDHPTNAMITFSYTPKGKDKKPKQAEGERIGAETARITSEQEKFRSGMKYEPGSRQDLQEKAEQKAVEDYTLHRFGAVPGTGGQPLIHTYPALQGSPDTGLQMPVFASPFKPKAFHLLDKQLELKPLTSASAKPATGEEKKEEAVPVQRKAKNGASVTEVRATVHDALRSSGRPLDGDTKSFMESRIGFDFGKVRIHTDPRAAASAEAMNATAYTVGTDVVFASDQYSPHSSAGRKLLAHELTHTVQQHAAEPLHTGVPIGALSSVPAGRLQPKSASDGSGGGECQDCKQKKEENMLQRKSAGAAKRRMALPMQGALGQNSGSNEETGELAGVISLSPAASDLAQAQRTREEGALRNGPVRFRVPTTADLKALFSSGTVSEKDIKNRVELALTRMANERRLETREPVEEIMKKVFPAPHVFDERAYERAADVTDRTRLYESVLEAETQVTSADKPELKTTMQGAASLIVDCAADSDNLASVFGSKKDVAKDVYDKAKDALDAAISDIDESVTVDYYLDDPEVGLGGWARFSDQKVHFKARVAKVLDVADANITIIHESSRLADAIVIDQGYYGGTGFAARPEDEKVTNAAFYEEIPRRKLNKSIYKDATGKFKDFIPDTSASGTRETFADQAKRNAEEYFRKAWDKAVDVHKFIRSIQKDQLAGNTPSFDKHRERILEISKLMRLTVH